MTVRRITALSIGLAGAFSALSAFGPASAQEQKDGKEDAAMQAVFISPAGKPYRAPVDKPYPVVDWFAAADADHDGKLTKAEFRADAEAFFNELDRDKNNVLDSTEVSRYEKVIAPEIVASFTPDSGQAAPMGNEPVAPHEEQPQGAAWFSFLGEPEPVSDTDASFNGVITRTEFLKAADERFALLDVNHKGYLTLDTLPKTPVQKTIERQAKHKRKGK
jgi:hypothetical protein